MGTIYVDASTGNAANSGCTNNSSPIASGTAATLAGLVLTLDGSPNLSSLIDTPGPTQSTINLAGATNANRTIFWITDFDDTAKTVTVDAAPTGLSSGSISWRIGGQYVWPGGSTANVVEGALGLSLAQDILQFNNTPATRTAIYLTARNAGNTTTGWITVRGATGVRPKLQITAGNVSPFNLANLGNWKIENLEFASTTTGAVQATSVGVNNWFDNILVSAGAGAGLDVNGTGTRVTNCEVNGVTGNGITCSANCVIEGNHIRLCGGDGIVYTGTANYVFVLNNLIAGNTGRGVYQNSSPSAQTPCMFIIGNTIINNTLAGIQFSNINCPSYIRNNIVKNSNAANLCTWTAGSSELFCHHSHNVFYSSGGGALGITLSATEFNSDPLFVSEGGGNYAISNSSPAAGSGTLGTPLNSSSTGYRDIGAFQRQVTAGGGAYVIGS